MIKKILLSVTILFLTTACGQSVEQLNNKGNEAFAESDYNRALETYRLAQTEDPDIPEPYYNAANAYYRQQDYEQAELQAQQALRDADEKLAQSSFYNLGNIHFETGNFEGAVEAYKEALRLNPEDREAKHNLELALQQLQQQQQNQQNQQNQENQENQEDQEDQENQENQENEQQQQNQENEEGQQNQQQQEDGQEEGQDQQNQSGQEGEESQSEEEQNQEGGADEQTESETGEESQSQTGEASEEDGDSPDSAQTGQVQVERLTPDQARQLLQSIAESSSTLQEHLLNLQKRSPANGDSIQDW